jgi:hypothetical protein
MINNFKEVAGGAWPFQKLSLGMGELPPLATDLKTFYEGYLLDMSNHHANTLLT